MRGWCLACFTGVVVLNTVRESATPDRKENKQADAGSRLFQRHFLCGALLGNCLSAEREGLSTQHVQRECSAEPFMRSILSFSYIQQGQKDKSWICYSLYYKTYVRDQDYSI